MRTGETCHNDRPGQCYDESRGGDESGTRHNDGPAGGFQGSEEVR